MAGLTAATKLSLGHAIADPNASAELIKQINKVALATPVTITFTAGNPNYTATGAATVANGASPTNAELLTLIQELNAKVAAL